MKVAVIGAGASGLAAVKACLEEGLEPTCYEKCNYIGGLWNYSPEVVHSEASVMQCTVSNVSKEMMCYSDFPAPVEFPPYMHHTDVAAYFGLYADAFGLRRHIKTNHEVVKISEAPDHDSSGRWIVRVKNRNTNNVEQNTYDFVIVGTGIFGQPYIPDIQGLSTFKGRVLHSHGYRDTRGFEGKNVLVVGFGNSAADAAVDLTNVTKQVYLSLRNGGWLFARINTKGHPIDLSISRILSWIVEMFPNFVEREIVKRLNERVDHTMYGFCPKMKYTQSPGCINDDLPFRVLHGAIKVKKNLKCFTRNGVEFVDGSRHDIDAVIFGTGYHVEFPFLSDDVIGVVNKAGLYKGIFPTGRKRSTLAVIGCFRTKGGLTPMVELQSRVAVKVFTGHVKLPPNHKMLEWVSRKKDENMKVKSPELSYILQLDYVPYLDELAEIIDCKPKLGRMLVSDPKLAYKCIFGPCCPYQYRLTGPHPWPGARDAIMTLMDRIVCPLNPNYSQETATQKSFPVFKSMLILLAVSLSVYSLLV